jgi:hypothetical protein
MKAVIAKAAAAVRPRARLLIEVTLSALVCALVTSTVASAAVTKLRPGAGISLSPNPITSTGTVSLQLPLVLSAAFPTLSSSPSWLASFTNTGSGDALDLAGRVALRAKVNGSGKDAIIATGGTGGSAVRATDTGSAGTGVYGLGGPFGFGLWGVGGSGDSGGVLAQGSGIAPGVTASGGSRGGPGVQATGGGAAAGLDATGGSAGGTGVIGVGGGSPSYGGDFLGMGAPAVHASSENSNVVGAFEGDLNATANHSQSLTEATINGAASGQGTGVAGDGSGAGTGVFGGAGASPGGTGVVGFDNGVGTYAARFRGAVQINGNLHATGTISSDQGGAWFTEDESTVDVSNGAEVNVLSESLPQGNYAIQAHVTLENDDGSAASSYACALKVNGSDVDFAGTSPGPTGGYGFTELSLVGIGSIPPGGGTVEVHCHNNGTPSSTAYDRTLLATSVGNLH